MPDPQTIIAGTVAAAGLIGAVTGLLAEVRRWRGGKSVRPEDPTAGL